jgi:integrase
MGIFTRPDSPVWWLWLESAPKGQQKQRTEILVAGTREQRTAQKASALEVYHTRMLALGRTGQGLAPEKPAIIFRDYATVYARDVISHHKGALRELELLTTLRAAFDGQPLTAITRDAVRAWMTTRRETRIGTSMATVSASTVNREVDLLKALLRDAVPTYLAASPLVGMARLKTVQPRRRVLTLDEERRLLDACADAQDHALLVLGIDTLQRLGDLLDLQRTDRHGAWIYIRDTKNSDALDIPLSPRAAAALDAIPGPALHYFTKFRLADPCRWRHTVRERLKQLCAIAHVPFGRKNHGITFHWATRRTGATRLVVQKGVPIPVVQHLGNWHRPDVLLAIYTEANRADLAAAVGQGPDHGTILPWPRLAK